MRAHAQDFRVEVAKEKDLSPAEADKLTHALASNWQTADLPPGEKALCRFAARLTGEPAAMQQNHILDLRGHGFDDAAIHDASQVISYFNYINRIADSLNVDLEEDIHSWELSVPDSSS